MLILVILNINVEDERAYGAYLSKCLKLLEPARETDINANIEAVFNFIVIDGCYCYFTNSKWRPHLMGLKAYY